MSDNMTNAAANAAAPKPKRPRPLSMIMLGRQTDALFENARLAKERGEKVGWSASIFPQEIAETLGLNILYPENHSAGLPQDIRPILFSRNVREPSDTQTISVPTQR